MKGVQQGIKQAQKLIGEIDLNTHLESKEIANNTSAPTESSLVEEKVVKKAKVQVKIQTNPLHDLFKTAEMRVGQIIEVKALENSDKLYIEKIDMGDHVRTILSGMRGYLTLEEMSGKVIVFANLKARKLAGEESNGMVFGVSDQEHKNLELLRPHPDSKLGELVIIDDSEFVSSSEFKAPNGKNVDKFLAMLNTNDAGEPCFEKLKLKTESGYLSSSKLINANIR